MKEFMLDSQELKRRRETLDLSQSDVAERVRALSKSSFSQQSLAKFEKNADAKSRYSAYIHEALNQLEMEKMQEQHATALRKAEGEHRNTLNIATSQIRETTGAIAKHLDGIVRVATLDVDLSAGHGNTVSAEDPKDPILFRKSWIDKKGLSADQLVAAFADGDSMHPRINDGDIVLIDTSVSSIKSGKIYAIRIFDEVMIKRIFRASDGSLDITQDNPSPEFRNIQITPDRLEEVHLIGRAVWVGSDLI